MRDICVFDKRRKSQKHFAWAFVQAKDRTRLKEHDNYRKRIEVRKRENKAAHTFTESDKQIHRSPGCVCRGEPHGPHVLPLHISIFIDPLKTQRHQRHHNSGLQHIHTCTHSHHTQRHANTHTEEKRHLLCKPQCLLRAKLEHRLGNNNRLNHHWWPRKIFYLYEKKLHLCN